MTDGATPGAQADFDSVYSVSQESSLPRLEVHMLWQHILQVSRAWLIAHDRDPLAPDTVARFLELQSRRLAGEPMAYILGHREFMGRDFLVGPGVLIPRPETELLVETALDYLQGLPAPRVLDLGTGTGAIAVSIALNVSGARVAATDLSADALVIARRNAQELGAEVEFFQGSWYDALVGHSGFDLIVSNPPYIAACDPHLGQGDLRFEPALALTDGSDGLSALRTIVQGAGARLKPGAALYLEHGWDQALAVRQLLQQAGFTQVASLQDLAGIERVTGGIYNQG
ncbi:peptide chain release factor N(5)-glutamine methyltransferase [Pollutimonas harenae]|uniref:Release factor glutamine methyltransferase n=1 Tax=Pollutimonas harenae TaxID=657015 RepID=A0A853H1C0_9BURK|nr:peptide chain release factor N(5)-glutamine methyltransferase [Pollutimonas harenae]NYT85035.1 peptide chain release factor N(5)-glutamine methyltransferase [Pollutimonas harenae]TEA72580.1 peptide chain release factor N(5)-glutamine methyltransferase [Pollutimonas harenae]